MNLLGAPPVFIGPLYQAKTIKVCAPEDPICADGMNFDTHKTYSTNGAVIDEGAAFAASRLGGGPARQRVRAQARRRPAPVIRLPAEALALNP